jgi:ATP-citrate lyase beta-subunit
VPRRKISEYRAKNIVNALLEYPYEGWSVLEGQIPKDVKGKSFVVKVDQAIKQRFKKGLIHLDVAKKDLQEKVEDLRSKGYQSILIEPYLLHAANDERYISFRREREGVIISFSRSGGVEIESNTDTIQSGLFEDFPIRQLAEETAFSEDQLLKLRRTFDELYLSLLEINPYIVNDGQLKILDVAIEVDSSAQLLVDAWSEADVRSAATNLTNQELYVRQLNDESPASFSLEVINPDGGIFLLLSGGGASVVIADEIFTLGSGEALANYGEYSGNPTEEETYRYTSQVLQLMLRSKAKKKVALIGGAVANFTDIAATFSGIITALYEYRDELTKQKVKFYVRRGGPRQAQGLKKIKCALEELDMLGGVYDPSVTIPEAVKSLVKGLK